MKNGKKILGVLGGMGPLATQEFYKMLIQRTDAQTDQQHINTIILGHATLPDRTEAINSGNTSEFTELLLKDVAMLEEMGAAVIAMPCNTAHIIMPELQAKTNLRIINMVEETAKKLSEFGKHTKIAILATDGTIKTGVYQEALHKYHMQAYNPSPKAQAIVMRMIYEGIKANKGVDLEEYKFVESEIHKQGCTAAILACTELSCIPEFHDSNDFYIDAMEVLTDVSICECGGKIKTES